MRLVSSAWEPEIPRCWPDVPWFVVRLLIARFTDGHQARNLG
uniref:Uncharacterized protein n=1 Tax=Arundo donax TaxID=35708 RepID=A0A0A9C8F6_ARUDO